MSSKPVDADDKDAVQQNARIDKILKNDKKVMDRTIKILLLGMWYSLPNLVDIFSFISKYLVVGNETRIVLTTAPLQVLVSRENRPSLSKCALFTLEGSPMMSAVKHAQ